MNAIRVTGKFEDSQKSDNKYWVFQNEDVSLYLRYDLFSQLRNLDENYLNVAWGSVGEVVCAIIVERLGTAS